MLHCLTSVTHWLRSVTTFLISVSCCPRLLQTDQPLFLSTWDYYMLPNLCFLLLEVCYRPKCLLVLPRVFMTLLALWKSCPCNVFSAFVLYDPTCTLIGMPICCFSCLCLVWPVRGLYDCPIVCAHLLHNVQLPWEMCLLPMPYIDALGSVLFAVPAPWELCLLPQKINFELTYQISNFIRS